MLERIEMHQQAIDWARFWKRPYSTIRFANNGTFELDATNWFGKGCGGA